MSILTVEERERLRDLEAAATPGPWEASNLRHDDRPGTFEVCDLVNDLWVITRGELGSFRADAELIAKTRNALPALLDAAADRDRLARDLDAARERLAAAEAVCEAARRCLETVADDPRIRHTVTCATTEFPGSGTCDCEWGRWRAAVATWRATR